MTDPKLLAKQKSQLKQFQNRLTLQFQIGKITTWTDLWTFVGTGQVDNRPLLWPDLKDYLQKQKEQLEHENIQTPSAGRDNSSKTETSNQVVVLERPKDIPNATDAEQATQHGSTGLEVARIGTDNDRGEAKVEPTTEVVTGRETATSLRAKDITQQSEEKPLIDGTFNKSNYGLFDIPDSKIFAYWFQKKAVREILHKIVGLDPANFADIDKYKEAYLDPVAYPRKGKSGVLLLSPTGTGKTYVMVLVSKVLWYIGYHENRTWSHTPYLLVTKSTVIEQTGRVLKMCNLEPVADVEVINLEMLRSNKGKMWVFRTEKIVQGDPVVEFSWKPNLNPCVTWFDESQGAKNVATIRNRGSTQGQIMCAYSDIKRNAQLICVSATPFTRVSEAKCFAVSTHKDITYILGIRSPFPEGTKLNNDNWQTYAGIIAYPAAPFDYVQASIDRLMEDLKDYIVRVTGVKSQFKGINKVKVIQFTNDESKQRYLKAWDLFCERKAKADALKGVEGAQTGCMFAIMTAFMMAAEKEHAEADADRMVQIVKEGRAAVCNKKYKGSIIASIKRLILHHGVSRDDISIIWGGGQTALNEKQKNKELIKKKKEALEAMGLTAEEIIADMGLEDVEDRTIEDFPPEWRLGIQTKEERQSEIDKFQAGLTHFCFYTLKAGGVGLSLHHTDELVPQYYGRRARVDLEQEYHDTLPPELDKIVFNINQNEIDKATKLWNNLPAKYPIKDGLHSCIVRLLRCRRKESGFVVEEDVPFNPVRQRETIGTLSYNAIELVQGVGRVPRLTSQSDTEQNIPVFAGTIETEMGYVVSQKLRCLSSVVRQHEDWQDIIMGGNNTSVRAQKVKELLASTENAVEEDDVIIETESDHEEEE